MEFQKGETVQWIIKDRHALTLQRKKADDKPARKKKTLELLPEIEALWTECMDAFRQHRTWKRARRLGLSQLACLAPTHHRRADLRGGAPSRRLVGGLPPICTATAGTPASSSRRCCAVRCHMLPENAPLVTALDDTRLPKSGRKIPGVGYGRDPMSPPFHVNLVLGQRFRPALGHGTRRTAAGARRAAFPCDSIISHRSPNPKHPPASRRKELIEKGVPGTTSPLCGRDQIRQLRREMDQRHHAKNRKLVVTGDGSYTNKTVLRNLPDRTTFIGRIRKDAKLHRPPRPDQQPASRKQTPLWRPRPHAGGTAER